MVEAQWTARVKSQSLKIPFQPQTAFIAYDRYNAIARPMDGKMTTTKGFVMICFCWFYT